MKPMAKLRPKYRTLSPATCTYFAEEPIGHTFRCMSSSGFKILKNADKFYAKSSQENEKTDQTKGKFNKSKDLEGKTPHVLKISTYNN